MFLMEIKIYDYYIMFNQSINHNTNRENVKLSILLVYLINQLIYTLVSWKLHSWKNTKTLLQQLVCENRE